MSLITPAVSSILAQARRSSTRTKLSISPLLSPAGGVRTTAPGTSATSFRCHQVQVQVQVCTMASSAEQLPEGDYDKWDKESLVKRVKQLEEELKRGAAAPALALVPAPATNHGAARGTQAPRKPTRRERKAAEGKKVMDPSKYSTRMIALKLAYLGKNYSGFEYSPETVAPTIEGELWKALVKTCLIFPEDPDVVDFSPFDYHKCGRTDRGVSAFGQVVNLRVRSQKKVRRYVSKRPKRVGSTEGGGGDQVPAAAGDGTVYHHQQEGDVEMKDAADVDAAAESAGSGSDGEGSGNKSSSWDPIANEIQYCKVLNRLLPPDIRVLAWAPNLPPNFSARFSCRERQYRYFFTQPAFTPQPVGLINAGVKNNGWLDIDAMRKAAKLFEGLHDFRNFAKIDPSKQITAYHRRIFESDIVENKDVGSALPYLKSAGYAPPNGITPSADGSTDDPPPRVYYFHVRGSAFLWHQIRHMVGLLFLVGQGLEQPSIVTELLDVAKNPRRPTYHMADEVPLVLWDCIFPKLEETASGDVAARDDHNPDAAAGVLVDTANNNNNNNNRIKDDGVEWVWMGEDTPSNLHASTGVVTQLWELWRGRKMDELLAGQLLNRVATQADIGKRLMDRGGGNGGVPEKQQRSPDMQKVFQGGNLGELLGPYIPVMKRKVVASPQEQNDKWAQRKGFASAEEMRENPKWWKPARMQRQANKRKAADIESGSGNGSGPAE